MNTTRLTRLALELSKVGEILRFLEEGFFERPIAPGAALEQIVDASAAEKARNFLDELRQSKKALHWELPVKEAGRRVNLEFSGISNGNLVIIAMEPHDSPIEFFNDFIADQPPWSGLGGVVDQLATRRPIRFDDSLDRLSALNNELIAAHRALARSNAQLRLMHAEMGRVMGMVAHDLRSPLGVVTASAELLRTQRLGPLNEAQLDFLDRVERSGRHMIRLVDDLVDHSAIESGTVRLELAQQDARAIVNEALEMLQHVATKKNVTLIVRGEGGVGVMGDFKKLLQVVHNLVSNAIKYSHPGTMTTITVERRGSAVVVEVQDAGVGIAEEDLPLLFEPFSRAGSQATAGERSTGLGLAISRRIVEAHGGSLTVQSVLGRGSTFTARFPDPTPIGVSKR